MSVTLVSVRAGEDVYVIGYGAFGRSCGPTVTSGILSRAVTFCSQPVMLQTTCAVQAGASGGAVVRAQTGELLGNVSSDTSCFACRYEITYFAYFPQTCFLLDSWPFFVFFWLVSVNISCGIRQVARSVSCSLSAFAGLVASNTRDLVAGVTYPHLNFSIPAGLLEPLLLRFGRTRDPAAFWELDSAHERVRRAWRLQTPPPDPPKSKLWLPGCFSVSSTPGSMDAQTLFAKNTREEKSSRWTFPVKKQNKPTLACTPF